MRRVLYQLIINNDEALSSLPKTDPINDPCKNHRICIIIIL